MRLSEEAVLQGCEQVGTTARQKVRSCRPLHRYGVGDDFLQTVRTPMGAYLGSRTHEEIAVSVVAEMIKVRRLGSELPGPEGDECRGEA